MSVLVRIRATGMDKAAYDQAAPGLHELVKEQPGFIIHVAYPTSNGFNAGEVWESKAQHDSWFKDHVSAKLPSEALDAMSTEYVELHTVVQP